MAAEKPAAPGVSSAVAGLFWRSGCVSLPGDVCAGISARSQRAAIAAKNSDERGAAKVYGDVERDRARHADGMPGDIRACGIRAGWVTGGDSDYGSLRGGRHTDCVCGIACTRDWRILTAPGIRKRKQLGLGLHQQLGDFQTPAHGFEENDFARIDIHATGAGTPSAEIDRHQAAAILRAVSMDGQRAAHAGRGAGRHAAARSDVGRNGSRAAEHTGGADIEVHGIERAVENDIAAVAIECRGLERAARLDCVGTGSAALRIAARAAGVEG